MNKNVTLQQHNTNVMKVYTHYYPVGDASEGLRWRTLLQFGDSWKVIGSVVMQNPGSAKFLYPDKRSVTDEGTLSRLRLFDNNDTARDEWFEFSVDNTMMWVGELFSQHHKYKDKPLNGVIQIFNLFYLREADASKALLKAEVLTPPAAMTDYDLDHLVAPIYLGFSTLAHHDKYSKVAKQFFDKAIELGANYLDPDFNKNKFYHPRYLMLYGKNKHDCKLLKEQFCND